MRNLISGANLNPGANFSPDFHPGANMHPLASRSYANNSCPYVPRFNLKHSFVEEFAVFECSISDSNPLLLLLLPYPYLPSKNSST